MEPISTTPCTAKTEVPCLSVNGTIKISPCDFPSHVQSQRPSRSLYEMCVKKCASFVFLFQNVHQNKYLFNFPLPAEILTSSNSFPSLLSTFPPKIFELIIILQKTLRGSIVYQGHSSPVSLEYIFLKRSLFFHICYCYFPSVLLCLLPCPLSTVFVIRSFYIFPLLPNFSLFSSRAGNWIS